jgi:MFS transporter, MHS family, proline/betaine transporter
MGLVGLYLGLRLDETPRFRLLLGYLALGAVMGCFVLPSFLSELFPTRVRSSGLAITYGVASALFGGTAPLVNALLIQRTGNPLLPVSDRRAREHSPEQGEDAQLTGPHNRRPDRSRGRRHD